MSIATNHFEILCLNPLRGQPSTAPAQMFASLYLTAPDEAGQGTEVNGGGYARRPIAFSEPAPQPSGIIEMVNAEMITFPQAAQAWGTILAVGIHDSQVGGNMLHRIVLETPKEIPERSTMSFAAGELMITASNQATTYWKTRCLNLMRNVSIEAIAGASLALFLSDPGNEGGGTEVSAADYLRQPIVFNAPSEQEGGNMLMDNSEQISFSRTVTPWGTVTHLGIMTAAVGGSMAFRMSASPVATVGISDRFTVNAGGIRLFAN